MAILDGRCRWAKGALIYAGADRVVQEGVVTHRQETGRWTAYVTEPRVLRLAELTLAPLVPRRHG